MSFLQEDIIKKLFGGHDIVTAGKGGTTPSNHAIRVEDLERGLRNNGMSQTSTAETF